MNHFVQRLILISGIVFTMLFTAQANHIAGGYTSYQCLGNGKYKISFAFYIECIATINVPPWIEYSSNSCGEYFGPRLNIYNKGGGINYADVLLCPSLAPYDGCSGGTNPGFGMVKYDTIITFPKQCKDWTFQFTSTWASTTSTTNVKGNTTVEYTVTIDNTSGNCNNSVLFNDLSPIYYTSVGKTYSFNTGAYDPDGDSLIYHFVPAGNMTYKSPWSGTEPITGIKIDTLTGIFTFNPNTAGKFWIAVQVDEYDRKTKAYKGKVVRQFEVIAQVSTNASPDPTTGEVTSLSSSTVKTGSYSMEVSEGDTLSFQATITDPNTTDIVTFQAFYNITNYLQGAQVSVSGKNPFTFAVKWKAPVGSAGNTIYLPVTVTDNFCPMQAQQDYLYTIRILNKPSVTKVPLDIIICKGDTASLSATGGTKFTWTVLTGEAINVPANFSCNPCASPKASPSKTTTYIVTSDLLPGNNTDTIVVTVNDPPVANAGSDVPICKGSNTTLSASGGGTYAWLPLTGLSNATVSNPLASPTVTTTYTVKVTNNGCSKSDSVKITVDSLPIANAGSNQSICSGDSVQLGSASLAGNTYNWIPATGLSSSAIANPKASPATTTTYTLTETVTATGCAKSNPITITVNPSPTANAGKDTSLCNGTSITLSASGGGTYVWAPATGLSDVNISNPIASYIGAKTYIVTVTKNGCTDSDTIEVSIGSITAKATTIKSSICKGDTTVLSVSGGSSFVWTPSTGLSSATVSAPKAFPSATITYTVAVKDNNNCSAVDSIKITVNNPPTVNAGVDDTICKGDTTAKLNPGTVHSKYSWNPTTGLSDATNATPVLSPSASTTYTLTATDAGCSNTDNVTITVDSAFASIAAVANICPGDSVSLPVISNGSTFVWSPASGLSNSTISTPKASPSSTATYTVTVTAANTCTDTASVKVTVVTTSTLTVSPAASSICSGNSVSLTASSSVTATYSWSPSTGLNSTTTPTVSALPATTITYTVNALNKCGTKTDSVTVTVTPQPSVTTIPDAFICYNNSIPLTTTSSNTTTATSYLWTPPQGLDNSTILNPVATPNETTQYIIDVSNGNCHAYDSVLVTVENPEAVFTPNPMEGLAPLHVDFTNNSTGADSYEWRFSETDSLPGKEPGYTYFSSGDYIVELTAISTHGCTSTVPAVIKVIGRSALWIPNSFTPGEDGLNDVFKVISTGIKTFSMIIFDRWGELVYESDFVNGGWDGKYKGEEAPAGVYVYILKATGTDNTSFNKTGHVTLLR